MKMILAAAWLALQSSTLASGPLTAASTRAADDTGTPSRFEAELNQTAKRSKLRSTSGDSVAPTEINLVLHVLSGPGGEGDLSGDTLSTQISVLNDAYRPAGFHFNVAEVRRYAESPYFNGGCFPTTETGIRMKTELAVDAAKFINVYFCKLQLPYIAGYGTLPNEFPEADARHGIVVDYGTVPGSAPPLSLGHTLVHELGHYLGLLHTFQGGCTEPGDDVADTPPEATASFGCPVNRDTCGGAGVDPIDNFMDYSDDVCTNHFSPLQGARMHALVSAFRPQLLASAFSIGPGMTGNWFDPSQSGQGFILEILPGNLMLLEWFVFAPNGGPTWIIATGPIVGDSAHLQAHQQVGEGGLFPPRFDPTRLQPVIWGAIDVKFSDCSNGQISWQPVIAGYTAGSMPIQRLTMPAGLTCP